MAGRATDRIIEVGGRRVPLTIRRNHRARRLILRVDQETDGLSVTLPPGVSESEALALVVREEAWVRRRLDRIPPRVPFADGAELPLLGVPHTVRHRPDDRGGVWSADGGIFVAGRAEHLPRRLNDWLRKEAKRLIRPRAEDKAARIGREVGRVSVKETRSRWGSCTATGNLNFCWRVVLMPEEVFDYIIAHEVAHLRERHHGRSFWDLVGQLHPAVERAEAWLKVHGSGLYRYG